MRAAVRRYLVPHFLSLPDETRNDILTVLSALGPEDAFLVSEGNGHCNPFYIDDTNRMKFSNLEILTDTQIRIGSHELDIHNCYDFVGLDYDLARRTLVLRWKKSKWGEENGASQAAIGSFELRFLEPSLFMVSARDPEMPMTEDRCVEAMGFLHPDQVEVMDGFLPPPRAHENDHLIFCFHSRASIKIYAAEACGVETQSPELRAGGERQQKIIGDPNRFAAVFELDANSGGAWMYGKFGFRVGGIEVGDYEMGTTLRDVLTELNSGQRDWRRRQSARFFGMSPEAAFRELQEALSHFIDEDSKAAWDEEWVRFRFLPADGIFNDWEAYVIELEGRGRILFAARPFSAVRAFELDEGECDAVLKETVRLLWEIYDEAQRQAASTSPPPSASGGCTQRSTLTQESGVR